MNTKAITKQQKFAVCNFADSILTTHNQRIPKQDMLGFHSEYLDKMIFGML
jgi:hypothetical protein